MRRSMAPSSKRARLVDGDAENIQPTQQQAAGTRGLSAGSCSQGVTLGGFLGMRSSTLGSSDKPNGAAAGSQHASSSQQQQPSTQGPILKQFKCPLPYGASQGGNKGSLGAKKTYSGGADLLASLQRRVVVDMQQQPAGDNNAVSELVLYDPEEHRLQWLAQEEAAAPPAAPGAAAAAGGEAAAAGAGGGDAATQAAGEQGTADPSPQVEPTAAGQQPPTAPSAPATTTTATAGQQQPNMAWEKRVKVYADPFLVQMLRPHQREGVKFVFECLSGVRQEGMCGAVLADGMGLGKTFQTIASLYCLLTKGIFNQPTCKKPLILCPTSLVQNWGKELVKWLGDRVEPVVVDDTKADKVKKSLQDFRGYSRTGKAKVLVMSYPCFRGHKAEIYKLGIDVLMCDEAHFLKNDQSQLTQAVSGIPARRRLLMSGTPIQNDLSEFHAVFDLACPGLLGTLASFRKVYEGPIQRGRDADATEKQVNLGMERMNTLMKICNRFLLRRTSTVLKELLPTKVEQVVFCKLSKLQLKLYEFFLQSKPVKALLASTMGEDGAGPPRKRKNSKAAAAAAAGEDAAAAGGGQEQQAEGAGGDDPPAPPEPKEMLAPLTAITALKKLCCHPDLIWEMLHKHKATELKAQQMQQMLAMREAQKRVSSRASTLAPKNYSMLNTGDDDDEEAEEEGGGGGAGKGGAGGKKKRASKKGAGGAPRQQLTGFEGCTHLFSDGEVYPVYQQGRCQAFHSGKVMVLEALLKSIRSAEPTDKVVLVSNYTEALDVLGVMCASHNWMALRLDGSCSVKQRQALVDTFNDPKHPSFVLLLSSKAGGVGLNIIGANRLVLFDPDWNPANDLQAMARVWREGQAKRVWIYRMLMAGSIEEKVLQRQLAKQGLSEALVDEVGQEVRTFSRDELRSLFKVNPNIPCETHNAIKCGCDGSVEAMASCSERAAAAGGDDAADQGILAWAHLARALDSPDPTWGTMSSFVRDNFVSYVFSDHVLGESSSNGGGSKAGAAAAAAGKGGASRGVKRRAEGDAGGGSDEEEEEEQDDDEPAASGDEGGKGPTAAAAAAVGGSRKSLQASSTQPAAAPVAAAPVAAPVAEAAPHDDDSKAQEDAAAAAALPPKPRPSKKAAAAPPPKAKPAGKVPAAARRRSASAAMDASQQQQPSGKGRRNSAPAAAKGSAAKGRGHKAATGAAAPNLSAFAFNGAAAAAAGQAGGMNALCDAAEVVGDAEVLSQQVDNLADLCPQLSPPLDDLPMEPCDSDDFM